MGDECESLDDQAGELEAAEWDRKDRHPHRTQADTQGFRMKNGKHGPKGGQPGELITRVPVSYLTWMVNESHQDAAMARAELSRRGTTLPDITVSGHAIDRASLSCRKIWHQTALDDNEGIHAWLVRVSKEALDRGAHHLDRYAGPRDLTKLYIGCKFAFMLGEEFPVLKTIMPFKGRETPI